jgi:radical SAM superfamily enzyme YgiQ (UPF0313 family)
MRIALVSSYSERRLPEFPVRHMLSSMRLAAYLKAERPEFEVRLRAFDETMDVDAIVAQLCAEEFDVVGLPTYIWTREFSRRLAKGLANAPSSPLVVAGGPETRSMYFRNWPRAAIFVVGQGEEPLLWLCDRRAEDASFDGRALETGARTAVFSRSSEREVALCGADPTKDMKQLPHGLDLLGDAFEELLEGDPIDGSFTWYETARGCIYDCSFCGHNTLPFFATFDMPFVQKEIENLVRRGIRSVFLIDPILGGRPSRGKAILRLFRDLAPQIALQAYMRPEFLDEEFVQVLAESNIEELLLGLQTTNASVPKHVRGNNFTKIMKFVPTLAERGVPWRAELIVGLPGDDLDGLKESLRFTIDELRPWSVHAYQLTAIPETQLFELIGQKQDQFWIQTDDRLRVTSSNSYDESGLAEMLAFAGAATSRHFYLREHERTSSFDAIARDVDQVLDGEDNSGRFGKLNMNDGLAFWHEWERARDLVP